MSEGAKRRRVVVGFLVLTACGGRSIRTLERSATEVVGRAASAAQCGGQIPVSDGTVLEEIRRSFIADGCLKVTAPCPPYIALGTHTVCTAEGRCGDVP